MPSIDHVLPLSKGGYDGHGNVLVVHRKCNNLKADRLPTGCEIIWLVSICEKLGYAVKLKPGMHWRPDPIKALEKKLEPQAAAE